MPDESAPPTGHEVQLAAPAALQVSHDASQLTHVELAESRYLPLGHDATHEPPSRYGVPDEGQLRQAVLPAASHVSHEG